MNGHAHSTLWKLNMIEETQQKTLMCVGAHMDDCHCGSVSGLSRKLANKGWRVVYLNVFAPQACHDAETRHILAQASACVGAENINMDYTVLKDVSTDNVCIGAIATAIRGCNPDIICIPWMKDNHYDHSSVSRAAMKAISYMHIMDERGETLPGNQRIRPRVKDILAYEISSWQTRTFLPDFYVDISREMEAAEAAIRAFTMFSTPCLDGYVREKRTRSASWGVQAGCEYAEAFRYLGPKFPLQSQLADLLGNDLRPNGCLQYPWGGFLFDE